jgi:hypothetical protein
MASRARKTTLAAVLPLLLALPATATAAPSLLGTGGTPHAAPAPDGTLHLAWTEQKGSKAFAHYCRVPPGAVTCAASAEWDFGTNASLVTDLVREPGSGKIDVVAFLGASTDVVPAGGTYLMQSTAADAAGTTFAARKQIAANDTNFYPAQEGPAVTFGPGNFQIGWVSDTAGTDVQYASTTPLSAVRLNDLMVGAPFQRMGLLDSTTAMIVRRDFDVDGGEFSWRLSPADNNPRVAANWRAQHDVTGIGSTLEFGANGVSAPVVASVDPVSGTDQRVNVRRFSADGQALGGPVTASEADHVDDVTTTLDPASNVHLVFLPENAGDHDVQYLASPTGTTWPAKPLTLSHETPSGRPVIAATADGNGAVLWRRPAGTGSTDDDQIVITRVKGPASAFPSPDPTPQPVDPACVKTPSLGIAKFLAAGCFMRSGKTLTTTAPFRVNGVAVDPKGRTVKLDEGTRTLTAPSGVAVSLGPISLGTGARTWKFPASGSLTPPLLDFDKGGLGGALLKLDLAGDATLKFLDAKTQLSTHLQLPAPFSAVNGDVTLKADNFTGLQLDGLHVHADELPYGFHGLDLAYVSDPPTWTGTMSWRSAAAGGDDFGAEIRIVNGTLEFVKLDGKFAAPGRELYPPFLYLRYLGLSLKTKPLVLTGQTILSGGPSAGDTAVVGIGHPFDTFGTITLTLAAPFRLDAYAPVYVLGYRLGEGELHYTFPGDVSFAANAAIGSCAKAGASMKVSGFVSIASPPQFSAKGKATACLAGASVSVDGVLSSKGIAACGEFGLGAASVSAGAGHLWSDGSTSIKLTGCSTAPYEVASTRQAGGARTFRIGAGVGQADLTLTGDAGPPAVTVTGPDGATYASDASVAVKGLRHVAVPDDASRTQTLLIAKPAAGTWTVTPAPGSAAITGLRVARDAPAPVVRGSVRRAGARRELGWSARNRTGRTVELFEEGDGELRRLGAPKGTRGTIRWTPQVVRGGRRTVTALVSQDGLPLRKVTLGTYVLPRPKRPGSARRLRATHAKGDRLVLRWTPGARAARQEIRVALGDGTRRIYRLGAKARTLTLKRIRGATTGRFTVTALRADGVAGPVVRGTVRAKRGR